MRNGPLLRYFSLVRWEGGGDGRAVLFVCRQMASCLLKKSVEERTQKVVTQQALLSFQWLGSFIPASLCEGTAERTLL